MRAKLPWYDSKANTGLTIKQCSSLSTFCKDRKLNAFLFNRAFYDIALLYSSENISYQKNI